MYPIGSVAVQVWFLKEDLDLLRNAQWDGRRQHCWELTDDDYES